MYQLNLCLLPWAALAHDSLAQAREQHPCALLDLSGQQVTFPRSKASIAAQLALTDAEQVKLGGWDCGS